jgi:hypothetical protein
MRPTIKEFKKHNWKLELTGLLKHAESGGVTGVGNGLAWQSAPGRVGDSVWIELNHFCHPHPHHWQVTQTCF